ncbi:Dabb family protein [Microbacterium sp. GXF7504]
MLFRIHDDASDAQVSGALQELRSLALLPGVISWRVETSLDARKGRILVEDATFTDAEAFDRFQTHSRHREVGDFMATISDWWIGDYVE